MTWLDYVGCSLIGVLLGLFAASLMLATFYEARDWLQDRKAHRPFPVFGSHERDLDLDDGLRAAEVDMIRRWMRLPTVDEPILRGEDQ